MFLTYLVLKDALRVFLKKATYCDSATNKRFDGFVVN